MSEPGKYPPSDIKLLYGKSGMHCAFPECRAELLLQSSGESREKQIGEIAHIVAHSKDGPRADPKYPIEKLDTYDNWILLCPTCHRTIDTLAHTYSAAEYLNNVTIQGVLARLAGPGCTILSGPHRENPWKLSDNFSIPEKW